MFHLKIECLLIWFFRLCAIISSGVVLLIFFFIAKESSASFIEPGVGSFFFDESWHPTYGNYNLLPMLVGSVLLTAGAVFLSAPLGVASAIYCNFYGSGALLLCYRKIIELLSGIPSVVFGFWGLMFLVPKIAEYKQPGTSLLAGIFILTIMILPTMALAADAALQRVPEELENGALALGFSKSRTIFSVMLPAAKKGLIVGLLLQVGRAIGETMAVLMVTGNVVRMPGSLFDPIRALTSNIALEMAYAMGSHRSALFFSGLVLILLIIVLVMLASFIERDFDER